MNNPLIEEAKDMQQVRVGVALVAVVTLLGGCALLVPPKDDPREIGQKYLVDARNPFAANVFVDGRYKGTTPATIRVRRDEQYRIVTLHDADGHTLRTYELENVLTSNGTELAYSFNGSDDMGMRSYDSGELPVNDSSLVVPYFANPVQVEDRDFRLTLIVQSW
ncbi:MAG: hypothetical protein RhofKO_15560 [Rhodothermales bacterium]